MNILSRWMTPDDVAQPTNEGGYAIAKQTQATMRMNGRIPYSKLSSRFVRYDRIELDKWLEDHAVVKVG